MPSIVHNRRRGATAASIAALALVVAAVPDAARAAQSATSSGGGLILQPPRDAVVVRAPVRAAVATRGARVKVELNGRIIARRSARTDFRLRRSDGLRFGRNTLFVSRYRGARRVAVESRTFTLSRRSTRVARLRVRRLGVNPGRSRRAAPVVVRVTAATVPSAQRLRRHPRALARALTRVRTRRRFRARLNGRDITRFFAAPRRSVWSTRLSSTHGLRPGANRLRVVVTEPDRGRHAVLTRVIRLPRGEPIAGAGTDRLVVRGARLRLDAGSSLPARAGALRHRWRVVERPRRSRARLRGATSARPRFVADRPGRYRVRLTVGRRGAGAASAQVAGSSDEMEITTQPPARLVDNVNTMARDASGRWGIQVGPTFYPNPSPSGDAMQALILDRQTLQPVGDGNWYTDGTDSLAVGIGALHAHIVNYTMNQLVILAQPPTGHVPVQPGNANLLTMWGQILDTLGASPFAPQVTAARSLSVIGVPYGDVGSAWQTSTAPGTAAALRGSFMDSAGRYAFSPQQVHFDTSSASDATSNTISVGIPGSPFASAPIPVGGVVDDGGLQVLVLDSATLAVKLSRTYVLGLPNVVGDVPKLHADLTAAINDEDLVFVQTIGKVVAGPSWATSEWNVIAKDLVALGASLPLVNAIDGSYTLIGGAGLSPDAVVETSSAFPAPGLKSTVSRLRGYLTIDHSGRYRARLADPTGLASLDLYPVIHQPAQEWPLTQTGDPGDQQAYQDALFYITQMLNFDKYGPDLRAAYYLDDNFDFTTLIGQGGKLTSLRYPHGSPSFSRPQFAALKQQLANEFDLIKQVKDLFDGWKEPFLRAQGGELVDLQTLGHDIQEDIRPPEDTLTVELLEGILGGILETIGPLGEEWVDAAIGAVTAGMELGATIATDQGGSPLPDRIQATVDNLSATIADSYNANAQAIDALRDVVVSDYGKLQTMAANSTDPSWANSTAIPQTVPTLKAAAQRMFYAQLLPLAYQTTYAVDPQCLPPGGSIQPSAWRCLTGSFTATGACKQIWMMGRTTGFPPAKITDPLVTPIGQKTREPNISDNRDGLGFVLEQFFAKYFPAPTRIPISRTC